MNYNTLHIETLDDLLKALQRATTNEQKTQLVHHIKQLKTDDDALQGAIFFLEDHNWDLDALNSSLHTTTKKLEALTKKEDTQRKLPFYFKYAALFIIPVGLYITYLASQKTIDHYYMEEAGLPNFMNSTSNSLWSEPMAHFKNGDYKTTIQALDASGIANNNDTLIYFKAVSYYKLAAYEKSIPLFKEYLDTSYSSFYYDADFRIAFALYKAGNVKEAQQQFLKIAEDKDHPYHEEATLVVNEFF